MDNNKTNKEAMEKSTNKIIIPTETSEFHGGLHFRTTILVDEEKYVVDTALIPGLLSVFEGEYETMVFRGHDDDDSFDSKDLDCDRCEENALKAFRMHEAMIQRWLSGESHGYEYADDDDDEWDDYDEYDDNEDEIEILDGPEGTKISGEKGEEE